TSPQRFAQEHILSILVLLKFVDQSGFRFRHHVESDRVITIIQQARGDGGVTDERIVIQDQGVRRRDLRRDPADRQSLVQVYVVLVHPGAERRGYLDRVVSRRIRNDKNLI